MDIGNQVPLSNNFSKEYSIVTAFIWLFIGCLNVPILNDKSLWDKKEALQFVFGLIIILLMDIFFSSTLADGFQLEFEWQQVF